MSLSRRDLLESAGRATVGASLLSAAGCDPTDPAEEWPPFEGCDPTTTAWSWDGETGPEGLFAHGVASGDPLPGAVVLWTRLSPEGADPIEVLWEVSDAEGFGAVLASGVFTTGPERDFTVKVDATCLQPGQTYWYRFSALGRTSSVGRTRTAPWGPVERVTAAVCSCANKRAGWFHGYRALAERADLDVVFHLGDYIYEGGGSTTDARFIRPGHEIRSLADYRDRYASYREDPDLQAVHAVHPFVCSMDDHETANNSWSEGAGGHNDAEDGPWAERKAAAIQAWFEWLPVRESEPGRMHRRLLYGDLLDVAVLDTRMAGRDAEGEDIPDVYREDRQMLGEAQEAWVLDHIAQSPARWVVLSQGVVMARWSVASNDAGQALPLNKDSWDGFFWARQRLLEAVAAAEANLLVLTGDVHSSWANDLALDFDVYDQRDRVGAVGVEAVAPGITSGGGLGELADALIDVSPHIAWGDTERRGFVVLDATHDRVRAEWLLFDEGVIETPTYAAPSTAASYEARPGEPWWLPG